MKISIFSDFFYPELSGVADSIIMLGRTLESLGHDVMFAAPRYSRQNYIAAGRSHILDIDGIFIVKRLPSIPYPYSPNGQSRIALPLGVGIASAIKFKPDIVHTQSIFVPGLEALIYSRLTGVPLVGTNHTPISEFIPKYPKPIVKAILIYNSWFYNRCSFVSAPSESLLIEMRKYGLQVLNRKMSNPVDLASFAASKDVNEKNTLKKQFKLSSHTVIYTGRLAEEKHVDVLIRALAEAKKSLPDISMAIVGKGSSEQNLRALCQTLGVVSSVVFFGFVDDNTLRLIYKASDIFAIMSTAETQSLSLMQAMSCGMPVIGARSRALPEYIDNSNGLLVEPGDHLTLANYFLQLFKNDQFSAKLGNGGIESVKQCSPKTVALKWLDIYSEAISRHHG